MEMILSLNIDCKSNAKTAHLKAVDYLKGFVKVIDIQKLYKEFFEEHISNLNDRVKIPFAERGESKYNSLRELVEEEELIDLKPINIEGKVQGVQKLESKLFNKVFEQTVKRQTIVPVSDRSGNTSVKNKSRFSNISSKYLTLK